MSRPAQLTIDTKAFLHNFKIAQRCAKGAQVMPVVKANAYGHGIENLINALQLTEALAVSCVEEAEQLRALGFDKAIHLLEGFFEPAELKHIQQLNLTPVIHQPWQLTALKNFTFQTPQRFWLKVNTGMNRLGFSFEKAPDILKQMRAITGIHPDIHLMTHFSDADNHHSLKTTKQLSLFESLKNQTRGYLSAANSTALLNYPKSHFHWVRPGIMLYGISPFTHISAKDLDLKPVMTLSSKLIAINDCRKGDAVGYCSQWIASKDSKIGCVAMGYADGYPRHVKNGTPVLIQGKMVPIVGRISMDMLCVDLTGHPSKIGDVVTLWGDGLPIETIARWADTIAYELAANIKPESPRLINKVI